MVGNDNIDDGFAQRLREVRNRRGLAQAELARRANVHFTHISKYERGKSRPSLDSLQRIATELGVSADYLLHGAEDQAARARFEDDELLQQFHQVQQLGPTDKRLVKEFLEAFLTKKKLEEMLAG